ncbi:MAG: nucleotidyltransferase family protein [Planctomycetes bacterium]|nr:nucleotidyltransferase family protein [Planctomycetota bacterium]MCH8120305.1 nucleotidyltransferase family protein [Planctomycetota bacterium]
MSLDEIKKVLRDYKSVLEDKYHVHTLGIFGSYIHNEQPGDSDLDILVDFTAPISLFEFIDMEEELSELLNVKVDLVSRNALKPYIGRRILSEVQLI